MITVVYQSSHISGLESKSFKTQAELKKFLADEDGEICSEGDARDYFIVDGAKSVKKGYIDKT